MKKLRILLLCSYILVVILTWYRLTYPIEIQKSDEYFEGKVIEIKKADTYTSYVVQGDSRFIAYAYTPVSLSIQLGQTVKIYGKVQEIEKNRNFYLFNYEKYLKSKKISYKVIVQKIELENKKISLFYKIKNVFLRYLESFEDTKEYMILLLYGENTLDSEVYDEYRKLGIIHLFAISGMHIQFFVRFFKKRIAKKRIQKILLFSFLTLYFFIAKSSPGITRAILCENISILGDNKIKRRDILIFVFFLLILYNPYLLYHTGFQLSFLLSFVLGFVKEKQYIKNLWKTSVLAFLVSIPIVVNMNFEINLLTPLYNLVYVPFISYLLFPSILFTFLLPIIEPILSIEIFILENVTYLLNQVPSIVEFGYFSIYASILFYFLLSIACHKKICFLLLFFFFSFHYFKHDWLRENKITLLDVGQGDSILIENGETGNTILIDTGGERQKSKALSVLIPSLKARGIHKLNAIILSHGDFDHAGSTIELVQNFPVDKVYLNGSTDTKLEKEILAYLQKNGISYKKVDEEKIEEELGFTLLHFKNQTDENEDSLVTYMKIASYNILLMGDAGEKTEKKLSHTYKIPKMDILKVGHHGSKYSSSKSFLEEIDPKYALISVGKTNTYGHPSPEVINRLTDLNTTILKTSTQGSIEICLKEKISIRTCLKPATQ